MDRGDMGFVTEKGERQGLCADEKERCSEEGEADGLKEGVSRGG